jgi:hypothetical protein
LVARFDTIFEYFQILNKHRKMKQFEFAHGGIRATAVHSPLYRFLRVIALLAFSQQFPPTSTTNVNTVSARRKAGFQMDEDFRSIVEQRKAKIKARKKETPDFASAEDGAFFLIDDNYHLMATELGFLLQERKEQEPGKVRWPLSAGFSRRSGNF